MKKRFKLLIILILTFSLIVPSILRINKGIDEYAKTTLKNMVYESISTAIGVYAGTNSHSFSSAVRRDYDHKGTLVCISLDSALINSIKSGLENEILKAVTQIKSKDFSIPLGNLSGIGILSEKGTKIKIKIAPLGTLSCDAINTFESVGINHTLHKVGFDFKIAFHATAPLGKGSFETKFTVLICETIIIGNVPSVYFS